MVGDRMPDALVRAHGEIAKAWARTTAWKGFYG